MYLLPFPLYSVLPQNDLLTYECSDRIIVPKSLYDIYCDKHAILRVENTKGESASGTLHGAHDGDASHLFVPSWMFYRFTTHVVALSSLPSIPCKHIELRPPTDDYFKRPGALTTFQAALLNYKTLTQHTQILVGTDPPVSVAVVLLHPPTPTTLLVFNVGEVGLTILPPLRMDSPFLYRHPDPVHRIPFVGQGNTLTLMDVKEDAETCRAKMRAAAKNRTVGPSPL